MLLKKTRKLHQCEKNFDCFICFLQIFHFFLISLSESKLKLNKIYLMYSSLTRRKRSFMDRLFADKIEYSNKSKPLVRSRLSSYIKLALFILILYCLNLLFGFQSYFWFEKSFENEYYLTIKQIDVTKIEENAENILGPPKNYLSNRFLIPNEYLCGRSFDPNTRIYPHIIILVKSTCENFKERQSIRLTWGNKSLLSKYDIRLAFVLGKFNSIFLIVSFF